MAQDSREIGMRVGAATNQAVSVAVQLIAGGHLGVDPKEVAAYSEQLAIELLGVMDGLTPIATAGSIAQAFPGTTTVTQVAAPVTAPAYVAPVTPVAAPPAAVVATSETAFSGSNKPLRLHEHPELPGWLHAQAAAKGVTEVWDNRGKPNYIAAIQSGAAKTPPPFRSSTAGNDTSFWPPK